MKEKPSKPSRTLLVFDHEGEFKVEIPSDAKLTFGPNVPWVRKSGAGVYAENNQGYALRIYQGSKENLLAIFSNIRSFRDITLPVSRLVVREAGKSVWKSDENGYKVEAQVAKRSSFEDEMKLLRDGDPENDLKTDF